MSGLLANGDGEPMAFGRFPTFVVWAVHGGGSVGGCATRAFVWFCLFAKHRPVPQTGWVWRAWGLHLFRVSHAEGVRCSAAPF